MKRLLLITCFLFSAVLAFATHNRAGEITFKQKALGSRTYSIKILTYTKTSSPADRDTLTVFWGDNTQSTVNRSNGNGFVMPNDIKMNVYETEHTYSAASTYRVHVEDRNRDAGVLNIPNSVDVPFYIETQIQINPFLGFNNSPVLLQPPIDKGYEGQIFLHNPNAYDPDGDSLSYKLVSCRGQNGDSIPGYFRPKASKSFSLNSITGDLIWDAPLQQGEYNVAFLVEEWRKGQRIGYVTRDLQIVIGPPTQNRPPVLKLPKDLCVEAGQTVGFYVTATDPDNNGIYLYGTGSPFVVYPPDTAEFENGKYGAGSVKGKFYWRTVCNHISKKPYRLTFKAIDNYSGAPLFDLESMFITVVPPAPKNPVAIAQTGRINLSWDKEACPQALSYKIYRRTGKFNFVPDSCELGVPAYTGYTLIDSVSGINNTSYTDDNKGKGLVPGAQYCYMIVALFPDNYESKASVEVCAELKKDLPVMTLATVSVTNANTGVVNVRWSKPNVLDLDTIQNPGPYKFELWRAADKDLSNPVLIKSFTSNYFNTLNDTLYTDSIGLNTVDNQYAYQIAFYGSSSTPGYRLMGKAVSASSIYLTIKSSNNKLKLNWTSSTPWSNSKYKVFKYKQSSFVAIATVNGTQYVDTEVVNGIIYCYYILSEGSLGANKGFPSPIVNASQRVCANPKDDIAPCPPVLTVTPDCDRYENRLTWIYKQPNKCANDVKEFVLYYKPRKDAAFDSLITTSAYSFTHDDLNASIAGCYVLIAIDSVGNRGLKSNTVCVDNCPIYKLPNVFTPNGDGYNDKLNPYPYRFIRDVNFKLFNRWGLLLFETTDPDINWDGYTKNGGECPDGVYFYICEVNEIHVDQVESRVIKGYVELLRSKANNQK